MDKMKRYLAIGGAIAVVVAIVLFVWFSVAGLWGTVLDIVLVLAALTSLVMLGALTYAVIYFARTVMSIKRELTPVLHSLRVTSSAVRESARTASAFGVEPAVRTASLLAGATEVAAIVFGRGHAQKRADQRRKRRQQIERELARKGELDDHR